MTSTREFASYSQASYLPLLLASQNASTEDGRYPLDRIRMQKAVFLLTRGSKSVRVWADAYPYRPYNWGPYSAELNEDLGRWERQGYMMLSFAGTARHGRYVLTPDGLSIAERVWDRLDSASSMMLVAVRGWVTSMDFNSLLREVYDEFPEFATKTRWTGAQ